ncbi:MAG: hypothetical protein Q9165_001705 [Trypethelium subeluteriae]
MIARQSYHSHEVSSKPARLPLEPSLNGRSRKRSDEAKPSCRSAWTSKLRAFRSRAQLQAKMARRDLVTFLEAPSQEAPSFPTAKARADNPQLWMYRDGSADEEEEEDEETGEPPRGFRPWWFDVPNKRLRRVSYGPAPMEGVKEGFDFTNDSRKRGRNCLETWLEYREALPTVKRCHKETIPPTQISRACRTAAPLFHSRMHDLGLRPSTGNLRCSCAAGCKACSRRVTPPIVPAPRHENEIACGEHDVEMGEDEDMSDVEDDIDEDMELL